MKKSNLIVMVLLAFLLVDLNVGIGQEMGIGQEKKYKPSQRYSHSIFNIKFYPAAPAQPTIDEAITITFEYATSQEDGVRILIEPFTQGVGYRNFKTSGGSHLYSFGQGIGKEWFTITSGGILIDQVRLRMYDAKQTRLLFEIFEQVSYKFPAANLPTLPVPVPTFRNTTPISQPSPSSLEKKITNQGLPRQGASKLRIIWLADRVEVVKPSGKIEIGMRRFDYRPPSGEMDPSGEGNKSNVQDDRPPLPPTYNDRSEQKPMNAWLSHLGQMLLKSIEDLVDDQSMRDYRALEETKCTTLYQKVDMRALFLSQLATQ